MVDSAQSAAEVLNSAHSFAKDFKVWAGPLQKCFHQNLSSFDKMRWLAP